MPKTTWRKAFIAALARSGNVTAAAEIVGKTRAGAYKARSTSPTFAKQWDQALEEASDAMELEAKRRAMSGVEEPVYYQGQEIGRVRKYSDTLLIFLLKAHRPEKFRDNVSVDQRVSGPDGGPVQVAQTVHVPDAETWERILITREQIGDIEEPNGDRR